MYPKEENDMISVRYPANSSEREESDILENLENPDFSSGAEENGEESLELNDTPSDTRTALDFGARY